MAAPTKRQKDISNENEVIRNEKNKQTKKQKNNAVIKRNRAYRQIDGQLHNAGNKHSSDIQV